MARKNLVLRTKSYIRYLYSDKLVPTIYPYILKIRAFVFKDQIIHVVGDSHTQAFQYKYPFIVHHLGAATAYNLDKLGSTTRSREQLELIARNINPKHESLLLVFGEIDCRIHIYNQFRKLNKKISIIKLVQETVQRYGQVMRRLEDLGLSFYVLSPAPASKQKNIYKYSYYASFEERAEIHKIFNDALAKYCRGHKYSYIDLYSKVVDKSGGIKPEYIQDEVHMNSKTINLVKKLL